MKHIYLLAFIFYRLLPAATAQVTPHTVHFKNGDFSGEPNIENGRVAGESFAQARFQQKYYVLLRFSQLPSAAVRQELASQGVVLYDYIPDYAFMAEMPDPNSLAGLKKYAVAGIHTLPQSFKLAKGLLATLEAGPQDASRVIAVSFFGSVSKATVSTSLQQLGARLVTTRLQLPNVVFVQAPAKVAEKIAGLPFVTYVSSQVLKDDPMNYNDQATHGIHALAASAGRNLEGRNVTIGVGDNGNATTHIDFTGRLITRTPLPPGGHGTHTTGTTAGAGLLQAKYKGMAPKATIISQSYSDILLNTPYYVNDYHMVLTNNSYHSAAAGCEGQGEYDVLSYYADAQLKTYAFLQHVFASGNDGALTCIPYPPSFGTVKSGFQTGKNVLTVGAINTADYSAGTFSSRGPVQDGRLKPEIVAGGVNVFSTILNNIYQFSNGTSMACPAVTGSLALLYERYRQLHGGADPDAAVIKALACNSADDLGNPGPDYTFGFGMLNARTAVEALENNTYFTNTLSQGGTTTFTITGVPAGTHQLKVMLYWPDAPAAPYAATALVNDLDLEVSAPDASVHLPLVLNPAAASVNTLAIEAADHTNNIEQVVINNPPAGNFTITVKGSAIPVGPQPFVVAYEVIAPSVTLEYPFGNETWVPGETEIIRWSAYGGGSNTFTLEYSLDDGATWTVIDNNIPSASRAYTWQIPAGATTTTARMRITRNNAGYSDASDYSFNILGFPVLTITKPCPGYAQLSWPAVTAATGYEVMMLTGDSMRTIASTTATSYLVGGLDKNTSYWLGIRAVNGTVPGRRSTSVNVVPNSGTCATASFDNDLMTEALVAPVTGRMYTSSQLGNTFPQVRIKNNGSIAASGLLTIAYQVNSNPVVTESITPSITGGANYTYTFVQGFDFSPIGTYTIKTWISYPGDPQTGNDTVTTVVKQLQNNPLILSPAFTEGFETALPQSYTSRTLGLEGLDRCDFNNSNSNGRARTFVNTGIARSGNRCITLDQAIYSAGMSADSLMITFNLSNYSTTDQLWLDFYFRNHGTDFNAAGNTVWIRGNETAAWIPVYTLPTTNAINFSSYQKATPVNITEVLAGASPVQTVSSSFQVKLGQQGFTSTNSVIPDGNLDDGFSFDDVTITKTANDIGIVALTQPVLTGICNFTAAEQISVRVKNYSAATQTNIPVSYDINGTTVTETITTLNAGQTIVYNFAQKANLSAYQKYTINVWVNSATDNYSNNDTLANIEFYTTPVIASFPYLEGFESNNGYWYTQGFNSTWQWGAPAKTIINKAANGNNAWVTNLTGPYSNSELSYLYSPCFNLSSLTQPVLSFSHIFQTEDDCDCDHHWAEYSTDDVTWIRLGAQGSGTNWYDNATRQTWQLSKPTWQVSSIDVPVKPAKIRFRFVMSSDAGVQYEGVGIDDIHVFEKAAIYSGADISSGLAQPVSGNNWIHFDMGGNRVVSINPHGQDLGNTNVGVFINTGSVRISNNQYYLDRNIVINPANAPAAPVSVRYYFLNTEANKLISVTGCAACSTLHDAYEAGVTQYSGAPAEENGTLNDNTSGLYQFITPDDVLVMPYDNGYYAQYDVSHFSEFWINSGGLTQSQPLPLELHLFTAERSGSTALLKWRTSKEVNISLFVVQKSTDGIHFTDIGTVAATNDSNTVNNYRFTDATPWNGANYYRLKFVDIDRKIEYSPVRTLVFDDSSFTVSIYPNPVTDGRLYVTTSVNCQRIELRDATGRLMVVQTATGWLNSLSVATLAKGVYFVSVYTDEGKKMERVVIK